MAANTGFLPTYGFQTLDNAVLWQYQPLLTLHSPNPPITIKGQIAYDANITEFLTLVESATKSLSFERNIDEVLIITEELLVSPVYADAEENIIFVENIEVYKVFKANDTLIFSEDIQNNYILNKNINEFITFGEGTVTNKTLQKNINEILVLNENTTASQLLINNASDTLTFSESFIRGFVAPRNINDVLVFVEQAVGERIRFASDLLVFTEIVTAQRIKIANIDEVLLFTEIVDRATSIYNRNIDETLNLIGGSVKYSHLGEEISIPEALAIVVPKKCVVVLESELTGATVILPCPLFGDSETNLHEMHIKRSMNNRLYTYVRRNDLQELSYRFQVGREKCKQLQSFIENNIDSVIDLLNWKGEKWKVKITSNPFETSGEALYDNEGEKYEFSIDFQGIRII